MFKGSRVILFIAVFVGTLSLGCAALEEKETPLEVEIVTRQMIGA